MRLRRLTILALAPTLAFGCYRSHLREASSDAGSTSMDDAGGLRDGAMIPDESCTTICDPPRVLARVPLDLSFSRAPAVLDAVVHRDELAVSMLIGDTTGGADPAPEFSLARISRRTGDARIEVVELPTSTRSIGAAALASRDETLTLIAVHGTRPSITEPEPWVMIVRWEGSDSSPTSFQEPLTDMPLSPCPGCFRRGTSVAIGNDAGLVALAAEGALFLARVDLDTGSVLRETVPLPSAVPNTALDARADRSGSGILALGGLREAPGATATPALAMVATESTLEPPISVPGPSSDAVPHPWLHDGALEVVRFLRDDGLATGRIHRYAIEGSEIAEVGTIATAGGLPPLVVASTASALLWVESSLTAIGEADLRVLAEPPRTCERVSPASTIHLPTPVAGLDPRVMVATEADGRTYAALLEQDPGSPGTAVLVVFDLGVCRNST